MAALSSVVRPLSSAACGLLARARHATTSPYAINGVSCYHADGNGNVTYLAGSTGAADAAYKYDPFRRTLASTGGYAAANVYRFSSKAFHAPSGFYYYGDRFYDPNTQRWLNRDPIAEGGGLNLYRMVCNDPMRWVDPYGLGLWQDWQDWAEQCSEAMYGYVAGFDPIGLLPIDSNSLNMRYGRYIGEGASLAVPVGEIKATATAFAAGMGALRKAAQVAANRSTSNLSKVAQKIKRTKSEVEDAVHSVKRDAFGGPKGKTKPGDARSNPNVEVDPETGDVYPETQDGPMGDCIGNIFDHLK